MKPEQSKLKIAEKTLLESIITDLNSLPIKDAVYRNDQVDVSKVIPAEKVDKLVQKYDKKLARVEKCLMK